MSMHNTGAAVQEPSTIPLWGAVAGLAASMLLLLPLGFATSLAGYVLAPLVVTGLVSLFTFNDIKASQSVWYSANPSRRKLGTAVVIAGFAVGLAHSWVIATEIAKAFA